MLPEARVVYGTYGQLNAAGDNAVLLPSHYMAEMHGYGFVIGPGKALDPKKLFLITSELFGNGRSSSPSNTPEPFHGPRFPVTTIRDNVEAVHRLLTEQLHVRHVRAVIGFSMGAQQAFQWAVSYPGIHGPHRGHLRDGKDLRSRHRPARGPNRRTDRRCGLQGRRLHRAAREGHTSLRHGLDGVAVLAGMVAPELWRSDASFGGEFRSGGGALPHEFHSGRRRQQSDPADAHLGEARRRQYGAIPRRRGGGAAVHQGARCSTCPRKPTCISRSPMRATKRRSSHIANSSPFPRCGGIRPAPERRRPTANS